MHLGATELFHLVTPTGSGYIYPRAKIWKKNSETLRPRTTCSASSALWIVLLVASDLPPLVSAAANGILLRRCCRSKSIATLGYGFELCAILNSDS